jgi:C1A family cysteine protease
MKSFALAALAGLVAATPMEPIEYKFINYIAKHGKSYATREEYNMRLDIFAAKDAVIDELNATHENSTHGHNAFSTYTKQEMSKMMGAIPNHVKAPADEHIYGATPDWSVGVNWVTAGAVSGVKDQGQCGSCWAFSSTGALESAYHIKMNKGSAPVITFSEQQLVDCVNSCFGCGGGW